MAASASGLSWSWVRLGNGRDLSPVASAHQIEPAYVDDAMKQSKAQASLEQSDRVETLLIELSARFINLAPEYVDREIQDAQRKICDWLGFDRSSLLQESEEDPAALLLTHMYQRSEMPPPPPVEKPDMAPSFPWAMRQLRQGRTVTVSKLDDLPAEAALDKESWLGFGTRSVVVVPLPIGSGTLGALAFDSARERGEWPEPLVRRLQLVAQVFTSAIGRKQADTRLQISEARYRSLVETQSDIITRSDLEGRLTFVNDAYCRMFGVDRGAAVNHSFLATVLPEDLPASLAAFKAVRVPPYQVPTETRHRTPHGVRWISWVNSGVLDASSNVMEIQAIGRDISDRKLAEAALHESKTRLASAIDVAALGFYEQTRLRVTFMDDRVRALLGIPQDQHHITYDYWKEHLHPDDQQRLLDIAQGLLTGRLDGAAAEYRYQHPQHGVVWISHSTRVLDHDSAGEAVRLIGVMQDITERKRMEEALRASEEVSRATFEQAAVGIAHVGTDGRWLRVNDRLCAIVGYSRDELVNLTFQDITHPDDLEADLDHVRRVLSGEIKTYSMEKRYIRKDRSLTWINLTVSLVRTEAGEPMHFIAVVEDINQRRKGEEEMGRLQRQAWHADRVARTAAITSSLAHELNQPLAAILSNAQAALRFLAGPSPDLAEIREILEDIVHDNKRASAVITGLRAMLRGKGTHHEPVHLGEIVQEVLNMLHSEFVGRQVEAELRCEADCTVLADSGQIQQVVLNLVMNAAEAMQVQQTDQRRIEVTVARSNPEEALVSVRDTGPGIPPEQTGKLFDAFWTTKAQGMGIGLSICRSIIEAHGGRIWLGNGQPGETSFCFTLRVATPAEQAGQSVGRASAQSGV